MPRVRPAGWPLLLALGVDNLGSGLFLPLTVVWLTTAVGLPLATAGLLVTAGTAVGVLAPPVAGRLVDRLGARPVVAGAQVVQGAGVLAYLLAGGPRLAVAGAVLVGVGGQAFYASLFSLLAEAVPTDDDGRRGPADRLFALADAVRAAAFGLGAVGSAALLSAHGAGGLRAAGWVDVATFAAAAAVLLGAVRGHAAPPPSPDRDLHRVLRDRPFLALIAGTGLLALGGDVFLVGFPVFTLQTLRAPVWVPGTALALLTASSVVAGPYLVRRTAGRSRTGVLRAGALLLVAWAAATAVTPLLAGGSRVAWLLAGTLVLAAGSALIGTRANALAEAAAPPAARGRYLAAFQYAFTTAGLLAPAVVAGFAVVAWLPWAVVGVAATGAAVLLPALGRRLGADRRPGPAVPGAVPAGH